MRLFSAFLAVLTVLLSGCGGGGGSGDTGRAASSTLELTPAGTGDFVLVGQTGIFVNSVSAAVKTPTLLRFTRFPSPVGLAATIPQGFGFVGAASIETVQSPRPALALAAPVILRIPVTRTLPQGRRLVIMIADDTDRVPVFRPLVTSTGAPVAVTLRADGTAEFAADKLGNFAIVSENV